MNKLQLPHAKLYFTIAELSKRQLISDTDKRILKEKVISDDIEIFQLLDKYDRTKDEDQLANGLVNLTKSKPSFGFMINDADTKEDNKEEEEDKANDFDVDINTQPEATSPVGTLLHRKKYEHSLNINHEINRLILQPCKPE